MIGNAPLLQKMPGCVWNLEAQFFLRIGNSNLNLFNESFYLLKCKTTNPTKPQKKVSCSSLLPGFISISYCDTLRSCCVPPLCSGASLLCEVNHLSSRVHCPPESHYNAAETKKTWHLLEETESNGRELLLHRLVPAHRITYKGAFVTSWDGRWKPKVI